MRQEFKQDTVTRNGEIMSETKKRKVHLPAMQLFFCKFPQTGFGLL